SALKNPSLSIDVYDPFRYQTQVHMQYRLPAPGIAFESPVLPQVVVFCLDSHFKRPSLSKFSAPGYWRPYRSAVMCARKKSTDLQLTFGRPIIDTCTTA